MLMTLGGLFLPQSLHTFVSFLDDLLTLLELKTYLVLVLPL